MEHSFPLATPQQKEAMIASLRRKDFKEVLTTLGKISKSFQEIRNSSLLNRDPSESRQSLISQTLDSLEDISSKLSDHEQVLYNYTKLQSVQPSLYRI